MPRSTGGGGARSSGSSHRSTGSSRGSSHRASSSRGSSSYRPGASHSGSSSYRPSSRPASRPAHSSPRPPVGGGVFVPYRGTGTATPVGTRRSSGIGTIVAAIVLVVLIFAIIGTASSGSGANASGIPASTANREKLDTGYAYDSACVVDEIGWINNPSRLSRDLQAFYKATGCQPFVYMKAYDPACSTDAQLEAWAAEYYDTNFADRQHVVFYAYACETPDPADDSGNGWQNLQLGTRSVLVMDAEAIDIFWAYLDADWSTWDASDNDGMYADIFSRTAGRIMQKTTTTLDVAKMIAIAAMVVGAGACVIVIMKLRRKHEAERAAETAAILNAPLGPTAAQSEADRIAGRYAGAPPAGGEDPSGSGPSGPGSAYSGPGGTLM